MATIKDVARMANVSPGTVTRFFNHKPLKESNRKRIEAAIDQLNYTVNPIARSLRSKKSYTIGVMASYLNESFTTEIITASEEYFVEHGYSLIICSSSGRPEVERERLQFLLDKKIDGLILFATLHNTDFLNRMLESGIPIVSIDVAMDDVPCDAVLADNINATYQITEELINNGHRRIGVLLAGLAYMTARERYEGYRRALADYKLELDENLLYIRDYSVQTGYNGMEHFAGLEQPPTAVIATNYDLSLGAIIYINEKNIVIPNDMSFVAFDFQVLNKIVKPSISVAMQPVKDIGRTAARILHERMNESTGDAAVKVQSPKIARLKFEYVPGNSVISI